MPLPTSAFKVKCHAENVKHMRTRETEVSIFGSLKTFHYRQEFWVSVKGNIRNVPHYRRTKNHVSSFFVSMP